MKRSLYALIISATIFLHSIPAKLNAQSTPPPNFKVAFLGDTGDGSGFQNNLNLIKAEGAKMVIHPGDFSYGGSGSGWISDIKSTLGANFMYIGANGNHDSWNDYYGFFQENINQNKGKWLDPTGPSDEEYAIEYNGITVVAVGDGGSSDWSDYAAFIDSQLSTAKTNWKICTWHRNGLRNFDTWYHNRALATTGEKANEMGVQVYEACRKHGAIIATAHEHSYSRSRQITKFEEYDSSDSSKNGITVDESIPPNQHVLKPGSTFFFVSGLGGHGKRDYNCDHHDAEENGGTNPFWRGDWWWASIYTNNHYLRSGNTLGKDCTRTGTASRSYEYHNDVFDKGSLGGVSGYEYGTLFITFNVDGNPNKASGYFKNIKGETVDSFTITTSGDTPSNPDIPGDYTNDNQVDFDDYLEIIQKFLTKAYTIFDFNLVLKNL